MTPLRPLWIVSGTWILAKASRHLRLWIQEDMEPCQSTSTCSVDLSVGNGLLGGGWSFAANTVVPEEAAAWLLYSAACGVDVCYSLHIRHCS